MFKVATRGAAVATFTVDDDTILTEDAMREIFIEDINVSYKIKCIGVDITAKAH